jgi:hypothetical protein
MVEQEISFHDLSFGDFGHESDDHDGHAILAVEALWTLMYHLVEKDSYVI